MTALARAPRPLGSLARFGPPSLQPEQSKTPAPVGLPRPKLQTNRRCSSDSELSVALHDENILRIDNEHGSIIVAVYVDEGFGGASTDAAAKWFEGELKKKVECSYFGDDFGDVLGFSVKIDRKKRTARWTAQKQIQSLDKFFEGRPTFVPKHPAKKSIMTLSNVSLPEAGSDADVLMRPMQEEFRSLVGVIIYISRLRYDVSQESARVAAFLHRPTYEAMEHAMQIAAFLRATPDYSAVFGGGVDLRITDVYAPYDPLQRVMGGLYAIGDANHQPPGPDAPSSRSMGGRAVMFAAAAVSVTAKKFHTMVRSSTDGEVLVASDADMDLEYFRGVGQFLGVPQDRPSPIFTDNDSAIFVAADEMSAKNLPYIIKHLRILQESEEMGKVKLYKVPGHLNPADALTKYIEKEPTARVRHMMFLMGHHQDALALWEARAGKEKAPQ
jgi:hypothetical protein